jgi:tetratricopeptide (TPR) repeat protein
MGTVDLSRVTWSTRLSNAAAAVWFYIGKLIWPTNLTLLYPRLAPSPWTASLGTASIVLVIAMLIWRRGRWGRGPLAGTTCVLAALLPSLGLIDMSYLQHADVADHFAYLSLLAAAPLVGAWIGRHPRVCWAPALMAIVALSGLTASRAWYFGHPDELWRLSALQNPQAWTAHEHVALALFDQKDIAGAAAEFRRSLEIHPANYRAWFNLGTMLDLQRDCAGAVEAYVRARALKPGLGVAQKRIDACRERSPAPGS